MVARYLSLALALTSILVCPCQARSDDDRVFAGQRLDLVRMAVQYGRLKLKTQALTNEILDRKTPLLVLFVPGNIPQPPAVRVCYFGKTGFVPIKVDSTDIKSLLVFADDQIHEKISAIYEARLSKEKRQAAIREFQASLNKIPDDEKEGTERYAGALLAGLDPSDEVLVKPIEKFRSFVEEGAILSLLKPEYAKQLESGVPFVAGAESVSPYEIARLRPEDFKPLVVKDKTYQKAWRGKALIITESLNPFPFDQQGGGLYWMMGSQDMTGLPKVGMLHLPLGHPRGS